MYKAAVITVSDKGYHGQREDTGGPLICKLLENSGYEIIHTAIVPDEKELVERELINSADTLNTALILTTGGTGFSPRDITPEATIAVCERLVPGIPEAMRYESLKITNRAMLTRAMAGIRGRSLIINLPGSPKAIEENLNVILPALEHGIAVLRGDAAECARK